MNATQQTTTTTSGRRVQCWVCYLPAERQDSHSNAYASYAGLGATPEQARENARYYANQMPWTVVTPLSRAPQWAIDEAFERAGVAAAEYGDTRIEEYRDLVEAEYRRLDGQRARRQHATA